MKAYLSIYLPGSFLFTQRIKPSKCGVVGSNFQRTSLSHHHETKGSGSESCKARREPHSRIVNAKDPISRDDAFLTAFMFRERG